MLAKALQSASKSVEQVYVDDVFSTWLYTGNGSTQTITNGIDLAGKGGLVWVKSRSFVANHRLNDTVRGAGYVLQSSATDPQLNEGSAGLSAFTSSGFSIGSDSGYNQNAATYASWTFRKQPKFFDVVTYTGNGVNGRSISHNLGSVPGCIIVKGYSGTGASSSNWTTYHRSLGATQGVYLNLTDAATTLTNFWNNTAPTSTQFTVGSVTNDTGLTFVAYLFAHDAGGFGASGSDNVISCGSFTTDGSGNGSYTTNFTNGTQWITLKCASTSGDWETYDTQRTPSWSSSDARLRPNLANAEDSVTRLSASGAALNFTNLSANQTYIVIAVAAL